MHCLPQGMSEFMLAHCIDGIFSTGFFFIWRTAAAHVASCLCLTNLCRTKSLWRSDQLFIFWATLLQTYSSHTGLWRHLVYPVQVRVCVCQCTCKLIPHGVCHSGVKEVSIKKIHALAGLSSALYICPVLEASSLQNGIKTGRQLR